MKRIRIMLDYSSYPVWVYSEDNQLSNFKSTGFELPKEIDDPETRQLCDDIQDIYESLFTDSKIEFCYNGFSNREDELAFMDKLALLVKIVTERLGDKYVIVNDIDEQWR